MASLKIVLKDLAKFFAKMRRIRKLKDSQQELAPARTPVGILF